MHSHNHGLAIMRCQPFHKGHKFIIENMANRCDEITIAIGSAQESNTQRNPFSFEERKQFVKNVLINNPLYVNRKINIIGLDDINNPPRWAEYVISEVAKTTDTPVDAYFCGDGGNGNFFEDKIPNIIKINRNSKILKKYSGTKIRELLKYGKDVSDYVPAENLSIINKKKEREILKENKAVESNFICDGYHLEMIHSKFVQGKENDEASYEMFIRKLPFGNEASKEGGYLIAAGQNEVVNLIKNYKPTQDDLDFMADEYSPEFAKLFEDYKPEVTIDMALDGNVVFPNETIMRVSGPEWQCLFFETMILNRINAQSLFATKASRIVKSANGKAVVDMGLRRAQDKNGLNVARGAYIGGTAATSNVKAGRELNIPFVGTIAHAYITSYGDMPENELEAFVAYLESLKETGREDKAILLVDTFDTLESGVPNAIKAAQITGVELKGIRLDSGDNVELSIKSRELLNKAGMNKAKIFASNDLNEKSIDEIEKNGGKIDVYGVGTKLATSDGSPALGGVYKLKEIDGEDRIKLSEDVEKTINPGRIDTLRILKIEDNQVKFARDVLVKSKNKLPINGRLEEAMTIINPKTNQEEELPVGTMFEKLQVPVMVNGVIINDTINEALSVLRSKTKINLEKLGDEYRDIYNPKKYSVSLSEELFSQKNKMVERIKNQITKVKIEQRKNDFRNGLIANNENQEFDVTACKKEIVR